jgi:hypothetical protein
MKKSEAKLELEKFGSGMLATSGGYGEYCVVANHLELLEKAKDSKGVFEFIDKGTAFLL